MAARQAILAEEWRQGWGTLNSGVLPRVHPVSVRAGTGGLGVADAEAVIQPLIAHAALDHPQLHRLRYLSRNAALRALSVFSTDVGLSTKERAAVRRLVTSIAAAPQPAAADEIAARNAVETDELKARAALGQTYPPPLGYALPPAPAREKSRQVRTRRTGFSLSTLSSQESVARGKFEAQQTTQWLETLTESGLCGWHVALTRSTFSRIAEVTSVLNKSRLKAKKTGRSSTQSLAEWWGLSVLQQAGAMVVVLVPERMMDTDRLAAAADFAGENALQWTLQGFDTEEHQQRDLERHKELHPESSACIDRAAENLRRHGMLSSGRAIVALSALGSAVGAPAEFGSGVWATHETALQQHTTLVLPALARWLPEGWGAKQIADVITRSAAALFTHTQPEHFEDCWHAAPASQQELHTTPLLLPITLRIVEASETGVRSAIISAEAKCRSLVPTARSQAATTVSFDELETEVSQAIEMVATLQAEEDQRLGGISSFLLGGLPQASSLDSGGGLHGVTGVAPVRTQSLYSFLVARSLVLLPPESRDTVLLTRSPASDQAGDVGAVACELLVDLRRVLQKRLCTDAPARDGAGFSDVLLAARRGDLDGLALLAFISISAKRPEHSRGANGAPGTTPLHEAAIRGHHHVIKLLGDMGADPEALTGPSSTALHCAARAGHHRTVAALCSDLNANVNARDTNGCTPLHLAAKAGRARACLELLCRGAIPDACDNYGRSAEQCASPALAQQLRELTITVAAAVGSSSSIPGSLGVAFKGLVVAAVAAGAAAEEGILPGMRLSKVNGSKIHSAVALGRVDVKELPDPCLFEFLAHPAVRYARNLRCGTDAADSSTNESLFGFAHNWSASSALAVSPAPAVGRHPAHAPWSPQPPQRTGRLTESRPRRKSVRSGERRKSRSSSASVGFGTFR
eukprot:TRINITY_DN12690_c0_g1_i1.p1 TRINITY_DN12690_c0_g1~~TRINITY_DN12690_c0_g1_i1.p1  ORF type:complete len:1032 (+),score=85.72 TRINITY_DN12690_c0_g1_i1:335-3097(+)